MGAMTVPDVWSGQDRMLTVEDMANMPDDEFRYELAGCGGRSRRLPRVLLPGDAACTRD